MNNITRLLVLGIVLTAFASPARAQGGNPEPDFFRLSLQELMALEVTTASRREQRTEDVAAAVYVITREDIRRSGFRTLPELFRLVPGVQVARVNASNWAISVRGSNGPYANKLLVLVDGRSIYNRGFSGVFWSTEDLLVDDIDRIEVIRGSGGAVWGANAVNGVINIVTRSAADTQGLVARVGYESFDGAQGAVRYGGTAGTMSYRLFSQWSEHDASKLTADRGAGDDWRSVTNGFRADWDTGPSTTMVAGSFNGSTARSLWTFLSGPAGPRATSDGVSNRHTGSLLGRWTRSFAGGSSLRVQSFFNYRHFADPMIDAHERTLDVDGDYHRQLGSRHDIVVGGGIREIRERYQGTYAVSFLPNEATNRVVNAFAQDEMRVLPNVRVTVGSKVEHDSVAGWGIQPTARVAWDIEPSEHLLWGAVSRALRTPSARDVSVFVNYTSVQGPDGIPMVVRVVGNPAYKMEELIEGEVGYRMFVLSSLSFDATAFRGRYHGLTSTEPLPPQFELTPIPHIVLANRFDNLLNATTHGLELAAHWTPTKSWRLDGSYSAFRLTSQLESASRDPFAARFDGDAPAHQWQMHSTLWLGPRVEAQTSLFYVGRLNQLNIAAYTRADARVELKLTNRLSLIGTGHNLLDSTHPEYASDDIGMIGTLIPRSAGIQLSWRY
jgi:iron complex outermembrane recepter protein